QTPTLALLVAREREILAHVPRPYWEILAVFQHGGNTWEGRYHDPSQRKNDDPDARAGRIFDRELVDRLMAALPSVPTGEAGEKRKKSKQNPPLLFDLTSLQR